jgi:hypothetical protein
MFILLFNKYNKMKSILINEISIEELLIKIGELIDVKLKQHQHPIAHVRSTYLTRQEVRTLLKISLPSLSKYTKEGLLQSYKIENRVLYKTDEVELAIQKLATYQHKKNGLKE